MGAEVHQECTFLHGLVQIQVPRLTWEAASGLVELTRSDADPGFAEEHFFGLKPARGRCCRRSRGCIYIRGLSFTINLIFLEIIFKLFSWKKKAPVEQFIPFEFDWFFLGSPQTQERAPHHQERKTIKLSVLASSSIQPVTPVWKGHPGKRNWCSCSEKP